jgi:hypothetical protein
MLCHLYADVVEEEGSGSKTGVKKKGGSMQTISATHRVSFIILYLTGLIYQIQIKVSFVKSNKNFSIRQTEDYDMLY